jgi:hypothetical protein
MMNLVVEYTTYSHGAPGFHSCIQFGQVTLTDSGGPQNEMIKFRLLTEGRNLERVTIV